jgi:hypothetical protein
MIMVINWTYGEGALVGTPKTRQEAVDMIKADMVKQGIKHDDLCAESRYSVCEVSSEFVYEPPSDITGTLVKVGE